jgi:hypothetical protein
MHKVQQRTEKVTQNDNAMSKLHDFIQRRKSMPIEIGGFEHFEKQLHQVIGDLEKELAAEELSRYDIDMPVVEIDGMPYRKVNRCFKEYMGVAGKITVERSLYSDRKSGDRAVCPLEKQAGIIEGHWTPSAARQAAFAVAHMTPYECEKLFRILDNMKPSKSSLDRLPKKLNCKWEKKRKEFDRTLCENSSIPDDASTMAVSLDGVMVPMKDGNRKEKRAAAEEEGKRTRGPAGNSEASCGTVSFYDDSGDLLQTTRLARMPETKKETLKEMLSLEIDTALHQRPDLKIVKIADGAKDNWTFLSDLQRLPDGIEVVDFYHACDHLMEAFKLAYGERDPKTVAQFKKLRHILRHDKDGVVKVIRAIAYIHKKFPRKKIIKRELKYFRRNSKRMNYAVLADRNFPIGSGVVEAACKTLVTERLKRSGMRWRNDGGQAILTLRSLIQSNRFDDGWNLLKENYIAQVAAPQNVRELRPALVSRNL